MVCRWIHAFAMEVDDDAECASRAAMETAVRERDNKIRCAEASLVGLRLTEGNHAHSDSAATSGVQLSEDKATDRLGSSAEGVST
jgi:hypothetical protein